ncbi:MAG: WD40 repeat domain-containing protein [Alphaproteobacteria bacterium]|nr:WD40 repeat domain-containing protein [Alphaproteobacteria bacterium]
MTAATADELGAPGRRLAFDGGAITAARIDATGRVAAFALGDGSVRLVPLAGEEIITVGAHAGLTLALAPGIDGGFLSGGDDGRLCRIALDGTTSVLATFKGKWIEQLVANAASGTIVCGAGSNAAVIAVDGRPLPQPRLLPHPSTVAGLALDPRGRRLAVAHYSGVTLWWSKSAEQTPVKLEWGGSHLGCLFSPNGQFVVSAMQENSLHGWRLADRADMQMTGYPHKVKSCSWLTRGRLLATSGAKRIVCWPFEGRDGPMGKSAIEYGPEDAGSVTVVAAHPDKDLIASGHDDGAVWLSRLQDGRAIRLANGAGAPASALVWSASGATLAAGAEDGTAALFDFRTPPK